MPIYNGDVARELSSLGHPEGPAENALDQTGFTKRAGVEMEDGYAEQSVPALFLFPFAVIMGALDFHHGGHGLAGDTNEQEIVDTQH